MRAFPGGLLDPMLTPMSDPQAVQSMFARIAGSYDLLNRVLSCGIDRRWRKRVVARAGQVQGRAVLDVCTGTGDLAVAFARAGARVVGVDFTRPMLLRAPRKVNSDELRAVFAQGDALRLPARKDSVDLASVAFGIRNVADRHLGLREMGRVVRPGGQVLVLEFSTPPRGLFAWAYRLYFTRVLPTLGRWVSKDGEAYAYLPRTVMAWPQPEDFQAEMEREGLVDCGFERLTGGIACLHFGTVPGEHGGGAGA